MACYTIDELLSPTLNPISAYTVFKRILSDLDTNHGINATPALAWNTDLNAGDTIHIRIRDPRLVAPAAPKLEFSPDRMGTG